MFRTCFQIASAFSLAMAAAASAAGAAEIPGLSSAALLPGWVTPEGTRMSAVDLRLEPGWKTYWRAPCDAGIPPSFDWSGSGNMAGADYHWPTPEVIDSGGTHTLGFHDRLLLPVEIAPTTPGAPVDLRVAIDFGLCREVCVPAHVTLDAPPAGASPDPQIEAALARVPVPVAVPARCEAAPIADGMRLTATVPAEVLPSGGATPRAAMELAGNADVWVSEPEVSRSGDGLTATADFVPPAGKPFPLDPAMVRLTLIGDAGATEIEGCAAPG